MKRHPHAKLMADYAEDSLITCEAWKNWQIKGANSSWRDCTNIPGWTTDLQFRRKPRTININGYEVPKPCREPLENNTEYFYPCIDVVSRYEYSLVWNGDQNDFIFLERGLVHLTKEAAELHAKAILSFTKG